MTSSRRDSRRWAAALAARTVRVSASSTTPGNPAVVNDEAVTRVAARAIEKTLGKEAAGAYHGTLSGEDFAEYLQYVPGVFVFTGINNPDIGAIHPQHSCLYRIDESVLAPGATIAAQWALDMLS